MKTACIVFAYILLVCTPSSAQLRVIGGGDAVGLDTRGFPPEMTMAYELMTQKCTQCHTLERVIAAVQTGVLPLSSQRFGADTSESLVAKMFQKPGANMSRAEARNILKLLNFLLTEKVRPVAMVRETPKPASAAQADPPEQKPAGVPESPPNQRPTTTTPEPSPVQTPPEAIPEPSPDQGPEPAVQEHPREQRPDETASLEPSGNSAAERIAIIRRAAEAGDRESQVTLGWLYSNGEGVPRDKAEAARWYKRAAEQGDVKAQLALGWLYYSGDGVKRDLREAAYWYGKAAAKGNSAAQRKLIEIQTMEREAENPQ